MAAHMKWKQELQAFCKANMAQVQRLTYELCAIPAPTGSEGRRAQFCLSYLRGHGAAAYLDEAGNVVEVFAEYDPESRGGNPADGRKVKGATIHWVNAADAVDAEVRLYDNLFTVANPDEGNFLDYLNPDSLKVLTGCKVEPCLAQAKPGQSFQFMRQGYFCADNRDSTQEHPVFNRSVSLKDGFKRKS